jgi:hypothetical protein
MHFHAGKTGNTIHTKTPFWEFATNPYDQIPEQIAHEIFDPNTRIMA